ncbi:unnamed protein product [Caenorhabditis brenneri]
MELRRQAMVAQLQAQLTVLHDLNRRIPLLNHRESKHQLSTNNIDWSDHITNNLCLFERVSIPCLSQCLLKYSNFSAPSTSFFISFLLQLSK